MNYRKQMESLNKHGIKLGLEGIKTVLKQLNNPQDALKVIHIAGTNGKGSTLAIIEQILVSNEYRVAKYTSPYLIDASEMFSYNLSPIDESLLNECCRQVLAACEQTKQTLTRYELSTAMMFLSAKQLDVDYLLLETGLGGRYDATNVTNNEYSLISNISYDHMQFLGNSLEAIAAEKCAIINDYGYIGNCNKALKTVLEKQNIKYCVTNQIEHKCWLDKDAFNTIIQIADMIFRLPLYGYHQADNFLLARAVLNDIGINDKQISKDLSKVVWNGRMQMLQNDPQIIFDGAHNQDACESLVESLSSNKYTLIFTTFKDKDYINALTTLKPIYDELYFFEMDEERSLSKEQFKEAIKNYDFNYKKTLTKQELHQILKTTTKPLLICGSLNMYQYLKK